MSIAACTEFGDSCIASAQPGASVQRDGGDCEYSVILGWSESKFLTISYSYSYFFLSCVRADTLAINCAVILARIV